MHFTYKDIKNSVRRLCFLEESEYHDYDEFLQEAINFAMIEVSKDFPLIEHYLITQKETDECGYNSYDMKELTKEQADTESDFMGFANRNPIIRLNGTDSVEFCDYIILEDRFLLLKKNLCGEFEVFYKKYPKRINENTKDSRLIEFNSHIANLLPLLCAWRIFKDDDETKAALYYNEYLRMKSEITATDHVKTREFKIGFIDKEGIFQ